MELEPEIIDDAKSINPKSGSEIVFDDVWFRYKKDTPWVLKGVNFSIKSGEKIALVGENGAGKSTLIKLLVRFYDPDKGRVTVGKDDMKDISVSQWRMKMAILFWKIQVEQDYIRSRCISIYSFLI